MKIEDGHIFIRTEVAAFEYLNDVDPKERQRIIERDHSLKLTDFIRPLMRTSKEYRLRDDMEVYTSDIYAYSAEQMKQMNYDKWGRYCDELPTFYPKADMVIIDDVQSAPVTGDYLKDEDAAKAWRALWTKLKSYNPKLAKDDKKNPIKSYMVRALAEVERLQALDRTLARRLQG